MGSCTTVCNTLRQLEPELFCLKLKPGAHTPAHMPTCTHAHIHGPLSTSKNNVPPVKRSNLVLELADSWGRFVVVWVEISSFPGTARQQRELSLQIRAA